MEKLTISAVTKPILIGAWFLLLAASPFIFPDRGVPIWTCAVFLFFALIILVQIKKYELSTDEILMKNFVTGKTTIISRHEIDFAATGLMPATIAVRIGLMKRGRMITVMSKNKVKINISTPSAGQKNFDIAEHYLRSNYSEFFKN